MPAVLGIKVITFTQALGILLLSKILFGGFKTAAAGANMEQWRMRYGKKIRQYDTGRKKI
jgi:hypothetical protein